MSTATRCGLAGVAVSACVAVGFGLITGDWLVAIIVGIVAGTSFAEKSRRRAGLPESRPLIEVGRKNRKPD
jgi:uncharacterized membrane protein